MADESKPEKAFPPSVVGGILGITYDLEASIWNMDERRWSILVGKLARAEKDKRVSVKEAEVLMGKLNYYSALIHKGDGPVQGEHTGGLEGVTETPGRRPRSRSPYRTWGGRA